MILKSYFNFDMSLDCVFQVPAQIPYNTHGILAHNGHNAGTLSPGTYTVELQWTLYIFHPNFTETL